MLLKSDQCFPGDADALIHAFILSRLDYWNALVSGVDYSTAKSLQLVQNTATHSVKVATTYL